MLTGACLSSCNLTVWSSQPGLEDSSDTGCSIKMQRVTRRFIPPLPRRIGTERRHGYRSVLRSSGYTQAIRCVSTRQTIFIWVIYRIYRYESFRVVPCGHSLFHITIVHERARVRSPLPDDYQNSHLTLEGVLCRINSKSRKLCARLVCALPWLYTRTPECAACVGRADGNSPCRRSGDWIFSLWLRSPSKEWVCLRDSIRYRRATALDLGVIDCTNWARRIDVRCVWSTGGVEPRLIPDSPFVNDGRLST